MSTVVDRAVAARDNLTKNTFIFLTLTLAFLGMVAVATVFLIFNHDFFGTNFWDWNRIWDWMLFRANDTWVHWAFAIMVWAAGGFFVLGLLIDIIASARSSDLSAKSFTPFITMLIIAAASAFILYLYIYLGFDNILWPILALAPVGVSLLSCFVEMTISVAGY